MEEFEVRQRKAVMITLVICNSLEHLVLIVGIIYASVFFKRFSLLWFLLMPVVRQLGLKASSKDNTGENENG